MLLPLVAKHLASEVDDDVARDGRLVRQHPLQAAQRRAAG